MGVLHRCSKLHSNSNIIVAFAAFWVNFWLLGNLRSNAVVYSALVDVFQVRREDAAWPSGIFGFFMCVTGALSGFFTHHISIRNLAVFGATLASLSVCTCSLASHMHHIIFLYGALQGIGVGMIVPLTHVILNQSFTKYKAFALGIAYSGSSAGSFIFPPFATLLLSDYGLDGTFLILGGIMFHSLAGALLYRTPNCPKKNGDGIQSATLPPPCQNRQQDTHCTSLMVCPRLENPCFHRQKHDGNQLLMEYSCLQRPGTDCTLQNSGDICCKMKYEEKVSVKELKKGKICLDYRTKEQIILSDLSSTSADDSKKVSDSFCRKLGPSLKMALDILSSPQFLVVSAAYAIYFSSSAIFLMVALDFAQDRGMTVQKGVFLVSAFSIGDFGGRLSFGWIADTNYIRRNVLVRFYLIAMGLLTTSLPFCPPEALSAAAVLLGVLNGSVIVNHSVLLSEYLGLEKLPLAMGFSTCLVGLTAFLRPLIIGFFRDQHKSYDYLFIFIGLLQVTVTLIWFAGTCIQIFRRRMCVNKCLH